jgi:SOS-response transcriptional repressor LexA
MGLKLTKKQQRILDFISDYIDKNNISPTYREIAAGLELKSVSSVAEHIDNLVARGVLKRSGDHGRVLEVVDLTFPETTALFKSRMYVASEEEKAILRKAAAILGVEGIETNE